MRDVESFDFSGIELFVNLEDLDVEISEIKNFNEVENNAGIESLTIRNSCELYPNFKNMNLIFLTIMRLDDIGILENISNDLIILRIFYDGKLISRDELNEKIIETGLDSISDLYLDDFNNPVAWPE